MSGKLLLVSGLSGAGKTTLIGGALKVMPELTYLRTYTTRPKRAGEEASHEYNFVSDIEYKKRRLASKDWDHTDYAGFSYGADAAGVKALLAMGKPVICAVAPDLDVIDIMATMYGVKPITIWIKTPKDVAKQRIYEDDIRDSRSEDFALSTNFDHLFEPTGKLDADINLFTHLLRSL